MGVVHLARRPRRRRGWRSRCCARTSSATTRPARRLAREVSSLTPDPQPVGRRDRRRRPVGPTSRTSPPATCPASRCTTTSVEEGPIAGDDLIWFAALPRRGGRLGARRRRAAPRRQAVQRADGGPHPDPHRLRPGPRRRRPQAHPHRLAARHPGLPRPRDPVRRRRHDRLRRALVGRHRGVRRDRPARRSGAGPSMAIMDRVRRGEHDLDRRPRRPARDARRRARPRPRPAPHARPPALLAAPADDPHPARCWRRPRTPPDDSFTVPLSLAAQEPARALREQPDPDATPRVFFPWDEDDAGPDVPDDWDDPARPGPGRAGAPTRGSRWRERCARGVLLVGRGAGRRGGHAGGVPVARARPALAGWPGCCAAGRWPPARPATGDGCRGRKWYDGVAVPRSPPPWHLVRSIPGTLLLALWSAGLAVAAALVCYAFATGVDGLAVRLRPGRSPARCCSGRAARGCARRWPGSWTRSPPSRAAGWWRCCWSSPDRRAWPGTGCRRPAPTGRPATTPRGTGCRCRRCRSAAEGRPALRASGTTAVRPAARCPRPGPWRPWRGPPGGPAGPRAEGEPRGAPRPPVHRHRRDVGAAPDPRRCAWPARRAAGRSRRGRRTWPARRPPFRASERVEPSEAQTYHADSDPRSSLPGRPSGRRDHSSRRARATTSWVRVGRAQPQVGPRGPERHLVAEPGVRPAGAGVQLGVEVVEAPRDVVRRAERGQQPGHVLGHQPRYWTALPSWKPSQHLAGS